MKLDKFCYWQVAVKEDFGKDGNQISWTCTAHLHEDRAFSCTFNSLKAAKEYPYPCEDAKPVEIKEEYDTTVECKKCGKKQYLMFANGLKNGWSKCCGYTMPIVHCTANIEKIVKRVCMNSKEGRWG